MFHTEHSALESCHLHFPEGIVCDSRFILLPCGLYSCRHCHEPTLVAKLNLYFPSTFINLPCIVVDVIISTGLLEIGFKNLLLYLET